MPWTCERCHHFNLAIPGDESTSLLDDSRQVLTCEACGHRSTDPETTTFGELFSPSSSLLDVVNDAVEDFPLALHGVSSGNQIELLDTPRMWGVSFDQVKSKIGTAVERVAALATRMKEVIACGRQVIDIVSLAVPDPGDVFELAIFDGIEDATRRSGGRVVIRLLFGYVPTRDGFAKWKDRLLAELKKRLIGKDAPQLFYGQIATTTNPAKVPLGTHYWNHAKIIAADGVAAIVGGHNFAQTAYAGYPMAHDISVRVVGKAAADAQAFCDYMWNHNQLEASTSFRLTQSTPKLASSLAWEVFKPSINSFACYSDPGSQNSATITRPVWTDSTVVVALPSTAIPTSHPFGDIGPGARIMALGRGIPKHAASDIAKLALIKAARRSIRICQQDLVFTSGGFSENSHQICLALASALISNQQLKVQIVVSPPLGWAGGDPYSWGAGAKGTYLLIHKFVTAKVSEQTATNVLKRLFVAPFCFTSVKFDVETEYLWPGVGNVAQPFPFGVPTVPMPGNHAKVFFVDDSVCYVGSDNLYPNANLELGFLIEGEAVQTLLTDYWAEAWWYSAPHCYRPT